MARYVECPKCGSANVAVVGQTKRFNTTASMIGNALLPGVGWLIGSKKQKSQRWHCRECGFVFKRKAGIIK